MKLFDPTSHCLNQPTSTLTQYTLALFEAILSNVIDCNFAVTL